ncbi:MAG: hypothetical protein JW937_03735 [Candidatus Omnitrophica bacterium]|nr:hypothetical protein [Candidatus Omnitrophota bacterium]
MPSRNMPAWATQVLSRFNAAFGLMSVIPLLICCYLITVKFFTVQALEGLSGVYFLMGIIIALLGLVFGRGILVQIIEDLVEANNEMKRLSDDLETSNAQLHVELAERERAQTALRQANEQLAWRETVLQQTVSDLRDANRELASAQLQLIESEKYQSAGRIAAQIASEVRNPLGTILPGVQYLNKNVQTMPEDCTNVLQDIEEAAHRANDIVKGMLDFSVTQNLEFSTEEVNSLVQRSLSMVERRLSEKNISLVQELGEGLPPVRVDTLKIDQALVNLLMNAFQVTPPQGTLSIRTYAKEASESEQAAVGWRRNRFAPGEQVVLVEIEDSGPGISEENLPRIFDPFFTTKPTGQATGLGLSVTRNIVELHEGQVEVVNREGGRGARAIVRLKVSAPRRKG